MWLVPAIPPTARPAGTPRSFASLVPLAAYLVLAQLGVALALTALWRARRLGPLVTERLPVVVRASETVEGHARLYQSRRARDRVAAALRAAAAGRLLPGAGLRRRRAGRRDRRARGPVRAGRGPGGRPAVRCGAGQRRGARRPGRRARRPRGRGTQEVNAEYAAGPAVASDLRAPLGAVRAEVAKAVVGQDAGGHRLVIALLCQGHVLLEGVPGVAKTLLVRALAAALALDNKRVQFTPDLMPGDVTGSLVYDARTAEFAFRRGPGVHQPAAGRRDQPDAARRPRRRCWRRWRNARSSSTAQPRPLPDPFLSPRPRTPWSTRAPTRCPRPSWTGSCSS